MVDVTDIVETGFGAAVLAFGVVAGTAVYVAGSLAVVPGAVDSFAYGLSMTILPTLSLAAWPNVVAGAVGIGAAWTLEEPPTYRFAAFVAVYVFLAVVSHSLLGPV